jgi:uncharacterized paraquat-inducible protein A
MNRVYVYWWNFKKAFKKVYVWLGIFFILFAGSAAALRDINPPSIVGAAVTVLLVVGLIWRLRVSFKGDWWDSEEEIRDKTSTDPEERGGGAAAFCPHCQVSLMPDQIDENGMCTRCGGPVQVGSSSSEPPGGEWAWENDW